MNLQVKFNNIVFKNPLVMASGTFGFGKEYSRIYDISKLGGISSKGLTLNPRKGNTGIRVHETPSGILNSVGLENPGIDSFINDELPFINRHDLVNIVNVGGSTIEEYVEAIKKISKEDIDIIELNISCPNVKEGGMAFGLNSSDARNIVKIIRKVTTLPLVVKLSPNGDDIVNIAKACEEEGADGISLVNTFKALAIDIDKRKPVFDNVYAGLSGPAIKPIALRMVHEVCKNVNIPVMAIGGVTSYKDVIEYIMAGAHIVQIGTANFMNPRIGLEILNDLKTYFIENDLKSLDEIRGII